MAMAMAVGMPCGNVERATWKVRAAPNQSMLVSSRTGCRSSSVLQFSASPSSSASVGAALQSFTRGHILDSGFFTGVDFGRTFAPGNGSRWFLMRHGRKVPNLNRPADQRKALLRGLTTQLLRHGRIKTTQARAKAMRTHVDHMITLAKGGSLHQRRQALGYIYDKQLVHALFAEVPERYSDRNGGYTRVIRTMPRRGDNAPMAYIELV